MLQAPCYPSPLVYGQSHYKKFWLRQTETEDETAAPPQHVANCPQKFSPLSSSFSPMAGSTPSQSQNQASTSSKAGTSTPSSTNASLAACANSFNAPRKGVPEYDLNQFEDTSEAGTVDCTLSLGTVKRERSDAAVPTGVSRSGSPAFGDVPHAYYNSQATWSASGCSEPQILFNNRNFPSDCTRDLYPQTTVPARQSRLASETQNHLYRGSVGSTIEGTKTSSFPRPKKTPLYGAVDKVVGPAAAGLGGENCSSQDSYHRALVPGAIGLCRSTSSWMPSLVIPEAGNQSENINKYCETPSPFNTSLIASPISGHSSVNGEDSRFQQRSTIQDLGGNAASSSAKTVSRTCAHCSTQKTPLWRNGPNGPKSLCNACGIRFKKAGKKNPSNGSSSELGSSLPSSPQSVKLSSPSGKAAKRKKNSQAVVGGGGILKQSWGGVEEGVPRRGLQQQQHNHHLHQSEAPNAQPWKRNRSSSAAVRLELTERLVDTTTTTESSGSEADENETGGSSGNSCLTWQHQRLNAGTAAAAAVAVLEVPSASSHAVAPVLRPSERSLDDFMKLNDVISTPSMSPYTRGETTRTAAAAMDVNADDAGTINAEEAAICLMNMSHGFGLRL